MYSIGDKLRLSDNFGLVMFEGVVSEVGEDFFQVTKGGKNEPKLSQCCKPSVYKGKIEKI